MGKTYMDYSDLDTANSYKKEIVVCGIEVEVFMSPEDNMTGMEFSELQKLYPTLIKVTDSVTGTPQSFIPLQELFFLLHERLKGSCLVSQYFTWEMMSGRLGDI